MDQTVDLFFKNIKVLKKDGSLVDFDASKIVSAVGKSARRVGVIMSNDDNDKVIKNVYDKLDSMNKNGELIDECVGVATLHDIVETAINVEEVRESYRSYRNYKKEHAKMMTSIFENMDNMRIEGDRSNANADSRLISTQRFLDGSFLAKEKYMSNYLSKEAVKAHKEGYIYIHDLTQRLYTMNCCVFDMQEVLKGGFRMGSIDYTEPKSLASAFNVIGDIILSASSQQYGGFTFPEVEKCLLPYAKKSYDKYYDEFLKISDSIKNLKVIESKDDNGDILLKTKNCGKECEVNEIPYIFGMDYNHKVIAEENAIQKLADEYAFNKVREDFKQGFQGIECMLNSCANSKGDYSFVTFTFGLGTSPLELLCNETLLNVRMEGQGKPSHKKMVVFPKLIFLYDDDLHGEGKEYEYIFDKAILCSSKCMYPDYTNVISDDEEITRIYKEYGKPLSQMGCRSSISPYWKKGGWKQLDKNDEPVMVGRFNLGVVSLNLPLIYAKAKNENKSFFDVLDYYLELIRNIHMMTYERLSKLKASCNPLAFMEGGFYGGHLNANDEIRPVLDCATYSFGITALNELEELHHGKSLVEDGSFSIKIMEYIYNKVNEFKHKDHKLYSIYGTPAEKLCETQATQFKDKYGIIKNVSDRDYFSNSFHCHVTENIDPFTKQKLEKRFWHYFSGGRIQYSRLQIPHNTLALKTIVKQALNKTFYNGVNFTKSYCDICGKEFDSVIQECPNCGSKQITSIDRVCGYLGFSKIEGDTRMNQGKMKEIKERKSM